LPAAPVPTEWWAVCRRNSMANPLLTWADGKAEERAGRRDDPG
jgi:hypothetical protein